MVHFQSHEVPSFFKRLVWAGCLFLLAACHQEQALKQTAHPTPSLLVTKSGTEPASSQVQAQAWQTIQPGVEWRTLQVRQNSVYLVRVDPQQVRLRVAYHPQTPKLVSEWMNVLHPLAVINGSYFEETYHATALTIADGTVTGHSYQGFGGMLGVDAQGNVTLQSLAHQTYTADGRLRQAVQSFPRLVWEGHILPIRDDGQRARRTAVALDQAGRLLLLVSGQPTWTLTELGQWLKASGLGIVRALNLDGGPSTGLAVRTTGKPILIDSEAVVPQVILIEAKKR